MALVYVTETWSTLHRTQAKGSYSPWSVRVRLHPVSIKAIERVTLCMSIAVLGANVINC